jgi:hypothetical protein
LANTVVDTLFHIVVVLFATFWIEIMHATTINAQIKPYSIAVAPLLSRFK